MIDENVPSSAASSDVSLQGWMKGNDKQKTVRITFLRDGNSQEFRRTWIRSPLSDKETIEVQ
jgi:hypothetical protein